ncbi:MAG TPA: hypothetical protein VGO51_13535 [Burkholderiaceae bacterium]|nr:hypothetical protein [Burkholderiaceae bacterium]
MIAPPKPTFKTGIAAAMLNAGLRFINNWSLLTLYCRTFTIVNNLIQQKRLLLRLLHLIRVISAGTGGPGSRVFLQAARRCWRFVVRR